MIVESIPSLTVPIARYSSPSQTPSASMSSRGASEQPSFSHVLRRLARELDRGERTVNRALDQGSNQPGDLGMIALQAGVYRYVEAVDLCTKLVDRATNAVRTTLQAQ